MHPMVRTMATLLALLPTTGVALLAGQASKSKAAPTPACALLSVADVRQITGRKNYPDHVDGDPAGEGLGGGSSCQYGGETIGVDDPPPLLSVVLIPRPKGKPYPEFQRTQKLGPGCLREDAKGVGDDAVVESCPDRRGPIAYVAVGKNDLLVQVDAKPASDPAARKTVLAIAKAAAANVK